MPGCTNAAPTRPQICPGECPLGSRLRQDPGLESLLLGLECLWAGRRRYDDEPVPAGSDGRCALNRRTWAFATKGHSLWVALPVCRSAGVPDLQEDISPVPHLSRLISVRPPVAPAPPFQVCLGLTIGVVQPVQYVEVNGSDAAGITTPTGSRWKKSRSMV
jgi:hypothetical protein